jgi:5-formyltetrahydrofolate cyclo-ligase
MEDAKQLLREEIKLQCENISDALAQIAATQLCANIKLLIDQADHIVIYHAYLWEISLASIIEYALSQGKHLYQPIAYRDSKLMKCDVYNFSQTDIFYPPEFVLKDKIEWYNLDLILLPLVAVDKSGYRLGKGGGYYDTTLLDISKFKTHPILCGVGFDTQLVDVVPKHDWDIKLDYFASNKQLTKF